MKPRAFKVDEITYFNELGCSFMVTTESSGNTAHQCVSVFRVNNSIVKLWYEQNHKQEARNYLLKFMVEHYDIFDA